MRPLVLTCRMTDLRVHLSIVAMRASRSKRRIGARLLRAPLAIPAMAGQECGQAVCLCSAELGPIALICRDEERLL